MEKPHSHFCLHLHLHYRILGIEHSLVMLSHQVEENLNDKHGPDNDF